MITEAITGVGISFVNWILGILPDWTPPGWMIETPELLSGFLANAASMGVWLNWIAAGVVVGSVLLVYVFGFTVRLIRALIAHVPQFGGGG